MCGRGCAVWAGMSAEMWAQSSGNVMDFQVTSINTLVLRSAACWAYSWRKKRTFHWIIRNNKFLDECFFRWTALNMCYPNDKIIGAARVRKLNGNSGWPFTLQLPLDTFISLELNIRRFLTVPHPPTNFTSTRRANMQTIPMHDTFA